MTFSWSRVGRGWAAPGHLAAEATPLGESEGRDGKAVPTPCPAQPIPSPPDETRDVTYEVAP
jgi:hypothetical protein